MPSNPALPEPTDPAARMALRIAALEREMVKLQRLTLDLVVLSVDVLPAAGRRGRLVMLTTTNVIYKDTGTAWSAVG